MQLGALEACRHTVGMVEAQTYELIKDGFNVWERTIRRMVESGRKRPGRRARRTKTA